MADKPKAEIDTAKWPPGDPSAFEDEPTATDRTRVDMAGPPHGMVSSDGRKTLVGQMVGEYQVNGRIGEGGMGTVYGGIQPVIGKRVAIKILKPEFSADPDLVARFVAEARAVNQIGHPNIVDIFSFGKFDDGTQYYVMEYLSGRSLLQLMATDFPIGCADVHLVLAQVFDALEATHHRGIIHRDLKPDNIFLVDKSGGGYIVKLLDFGIAKFSDASATSSRTQTGVTMGTPAYMSPEQCRGRGIDHRSDIYSLGVILYEMFTNHIPFDLPSSAEIVSAHLTKPPPPLRTYAIIPEELERIIMMCLEKDPEKRPQSIAALRHELLPLLKEISSTAGEVPQLLKKPQLVLDPLFLATTRPAIRNENLPTGASRRIKRSITTYALVLLAVLASIGFASWRFLRSSPVTPPLPVVTKVAPPPIVIPLPPAAAKTPAISEPHAPALPAFTKIATSPSDKKAPAKRAKRARQPSAVRDAVVADPFQ